MKRKLKIIESFSDRSKVIICLLLCFILGIADYVTGDLSLLIFYSFPIVFAAWFIGQRAGVYFALLSSMQIFIIEMLVVPGKVPMAGLRHWNTLMEVCYLFLTASLVSKVRIETEIVKQRSIALESANQELESFSYSISHDLRSPLVWMGGYCRSILKNYGDKLDALSREQLRGICSGILRMEQLITSLLDLSRLAQGELICTVTDLSEMARSVATELTLAEPARLVKFNITEGVTGRGDQRLLRVVLDNLLKNAWKYTREQEYAVIAFGVTEIEGKYAYFVHDNGAGFNMALADKLFVPFQRLHSADIFKGHGIGLATVKRIISRHHGEIWAEGREGQGATFYFTLGTQLGT